MFFHRFKVDDWARRVILRLLRKLPRLKIVKDLNYYIARHKHRSRKSRQHSYFTCFYTGLILHKRVDPFSGYTVEHLVPKFLIRNIPQVYLQKFKFDKVHRVPAISIINHLIGHAPLIVKYGLREYLHAYPVDRSRSVDDQIEEYVHATRLYLDQFKVMIGEHQVNHMPWYYASMVEQEFRDKLFDIYYSLLTKEEKILWQIRELNENKKL